MVYVLLHLTAAFIFGFSFVAMQRASAHLSAFAFNGITWLLGRLVVLPLAIRLPPPADGGQFLKREPPLETHW